MLPLILKGASASRRRAWSGSPIGGRSSESVSLSGCDIDRPPELFPRRVGTPAGIIDKLKREVKCPVANPKLKTQLADLGGIILSGSSAWHDVLGLGLGAIGRKLIKRFNKWHSEIYSVKHQYHSFVSCLH
jgi:hypothetical protein